MPDDADIVAYVRRADADRARERPIDEAEVDRRAKRDGKIVSWREMIACCGLSDARDLNRALRTTIGGLKDDFADEDAADRLTAYCMQNAIFRPTEGCFQPVMERPLSDLFARCGWRDIVLGDEFGEHDITKPLAFLEGDNAWWSRSDWPLIYGARRIYAPDRSIIAIGHWDQFFTVLAMTAERAAQSKPATLFEGFWCGDDTSIDWLLDAPQPLLGPSP